MRSRLGTTPTSGEQGEDHSSWIEGVAILVCVVVVCILCDINYLGDPTLHHPKNILKKT